MKKPTLFIVRGLPGSGKSTLAKHLTKSIHTHAGTRCHHVEADQFFMSGYGPDDPYDFDQRFLGAAHDECYGRTMRYLRRGDSVCVANTFSTQREVDRYLSGLKRMGLDVNVQIIKCVGEFESEHAVPKRVISNMRGRWQDIEGEVVFNGEFK